MALLQVSLCGSGPVDNLPGQAETQLISAGDQVLQVLCLMRLTLPRIFIPGWDVKFSSTILKQLLVNVRLVIQDLKCKPFFGFFSCKGLTLPVCQCSTVPLCQCIQCATASASLECSSAPKLHSTFSELAIQGNKRSLDYQNQHVSPLKLQYLILDLCDNCF